MTDAWTTKAAKFPVGSKVFAKVDSVGDHGVFVELEAPVLALVHRADLPSDRGPADYHRGDSLEVIVTSVDVAKQRVGAKVEKLWEGAMKYPPGHRARGHVESVSDLGVFVLLSRDYPALVHASELPAGAKCADYRVGVEVEVLIREVDAPKQRIAARMISKPK